MGKAGKSDSYISKGDIMYELAASVFTKCLNTMSDINTHT